MIDREEADILPSRPLVAGGKAGEIVRVARGEFARLGYRGVTMRGIAMAADVSTRTVYNNFEDKLALFTACINAGAARFPVIALDGTASDTLCRLATDMLLHLSAPLSHQISLMIFRDGNDFPEIRQVAKQNFETYLIGPLATYLINEGASPQDASNFARLFCNMATSEWYRRILFNEPGLTRNEAESHARSVAHIFLRGVTLGQIAPVDRL